jgi:hypothetical protein
VSLSRRAFRRGILEGHRGWTWFGIVLWTVRALRWLGRRDTGVVYSAKLKPGTTLQLTAVAPKRRSSGTMGE